MSYISSNKQGHKKQLAFIRCAHYYSQQYLAPYWGGGNKAAA